MNLNTDRVYSKLCDMVSKKYTKPREIGIDSLALALQTDIDKLLPLLQALQQEEKIVIRKPEKVLKSHASALAGKVMLIEDSI